MQTAEYIWKNGEFIEWEKATTHVLTHALHYGTAFFEGIRLYDTPDGPKIFRLQDHMQRLQDSLKIYQLELPYSVDALCENTIALLNKINLKSGYIRPLAYIGYGALGILPKEINIDVIIAAFPWGAYLGDEALEKGIDACISSWNRVAPNTIPPTSKAAGNYLSGFLIGKEAYDRGFTEGIGLGPDGLLSEGAGENIFVVKKGVLFTPPTSSSILSGITRDSVLQIAKDLGIEAQEKTISRETLYLADEVFMTGTAAEITPVCSIDRINIGNGKPGPITQKVQKSFFGLFDNNVADAHGWLTPTTL